MNHKINQLFKLCILLLILAASTFYAAYAAGGTTTETIGNLVIHRTAPINSDIGQKIWILLQIENAGNQEANFTFVEKIGNAEFDRSQAKSIEVFDPGPAGLPAPDDGERLKLWYYEWTIQLPPEKSATLTYWLVPNTPGTYVISPATITIDGEMHHTQSWNISIRCQADAFCDFEDGENYLTCPEDCFTGSADGICDGVSDGRIDPDCIEGSDPDSAAVPLVVTPIAAPQPSPFQFPVLLIAVAIFLGACVGGFMILYGIRLIKRG
jgi:hypothetical protein